MTLPEMQITDRFTVTKSEMKALVDNIEADGYCHRTVYLTPLSLDRINLLSSLTNCEHQMLVQLKPTATGICIFSYKDVSMAIMPPFPVPMNLITKGMDQSVLDRILTSTHKIGVVLLRLGRYSVGIVQTDKVLVSKSGTRYVRNRHRAGGSSANRFARNRQRLIQEFYDKTCNVTNELLGPLENRLDYIILGGETHTIKRFVKRCDILKRLESITLKRILNIDRPSKRTIERIPQKIGESKVVLFSKTPR